jgi:hypothetical protein
MLHYGNYGNAVAASTVISASLGSGLSVITTEPAASRTTRDERWPGGVLSWRLGDLAPGAEGTILLHVRTGSLPPDGSLILADAQTTSADVDGSNNAATELVTADPTAPADQQRVFLPMVRR